MGLAANSDDLIHKLVGRQPRDVHRELDVALVSSRNRAVDSNYMVIGCSLRVVVVIRYLDIDSVPCGDGGIGDGIGAESECLE